MTRLKSILLVGTVLPALTLIPFSAVSAQTPDQGERHGPHQHEGSGAKGDHKGEQRGEGHAQKEGTEGHQGASARGNAHGAPKASDAADDTSPNEGKRGEGRRHAQETDKARPSRDSDEPKAAKDSKQPSSGDHGAQSREERKNRREMSRDRDEGGKPRDGVTEGTAKENAQDHLRAGERDDHARKDRDRAEDRRDGDRTRAGENGRPDDRMRAGDRDRDVRPGERGERRVGGAATGAGPGFAGGFMPRTQARRLDDVRRDRREVREGDNVFIREPGRTIIQERGRAFIVHDETDRFRALGMNVRREQRGGEVVDVITRPGGEEILTYTDPSGRMLRRVRRTRDGREIVLIDNAVGGRIGPYAEDVVALPPPPLRIPRDRYVVDYAAVGGAVIYDTLIAPPLAAPPRRYTLDQIRYSPDIRSYVRSVDINTINFDSGSWEVPASATGKLEALATAVNKAVDRNPNSVFLIEGYTDATGNPDDNLSLSDRRAQSVAEILSKDFKVPPENLTTQGYGQQNLKVDTQGPSEANRRVVVQNITQLLAAGDESPAGH